MIIKKQQASTFIILLWLLLCASIPGMSFAIRIANLYQTEVVVPSQAPEYRPLALTQAMKQVLVRTTGTTDILSSQAIKTALPNVRKYIVDYGYQHPKGLHADTGKIEMFVNFNQNQIKQLIKTAGYKIWGKNRPIVLVWLAVARYQQAPVLLGADSDDPITQDLRQDMHVRGLPLLLPELDVLDMQHIHISDIWKTNNRAILSASKRYATNAELVLRLSQDSLNNWMIRADLILNNNDLSYAESGPRVNEVMQQVIDKATSAIALHYTGNNQVLASQVAMTITHVDNVVTYAKLLKYLQSFNQISDLQVHQVANHQVQLILDIEGGVEALNNLLALDNKIIPTKKDLGAKNTVHSFYYKWNGK